jgi:hypothetical protein
MAKSFKTKLIGQIGEHLVVAELGRLGIIATPFAGNVPDIDVLTYANGNSVPLQVKANKAGSWQFDASDFLDIRLDGDRQIIEGLKSDLDSQLIMVLVKVGAALGDDRFYVLQKGHLQKTIHGVHQGWLQKHGGVRPRNPQSFHTTVSESAIESQRDRWDLIQKRLKMAVE